MLGGLLEVIIVEAQGIPESDSWGKTDPYVLIQYKHETLKTPVSKGHGLNPIWNERYTLWVQYPEPDHKYDVVLKIMDKDKFSSDDFLGETTICVKDVIAKGMEEGKFHQPPGLYDIISGSDNHKTKCGEIQVGFTFTRNISD